VRRDSVVVRGSSYDRIFFEPVTSVDFQRIAVMDVTLDVWVAHDVRSRGYVYYDALHRIPAATTFTV